VQVQTLLKHTAAVAVEPMLELLTGFLVVLEVVVVQNKRLELRLEVSGTPQTHLRHKEMMAAQAYIFQLETFTQRGEVAVLLTPVVRQQVLLPATAATELQVLFLV
jgi:hypothetical protein